MSRILFRNVGFLPLVVSASEKRHSLAPHFSTAMFISVRTVL